MTGIRGDRLAWPAVGMEAAAVMTGAEAPQKLDSAMSDLTALLMTLESELRDGSKDELKPDPIVTPAAGLGKAEKIDSALSVLTKQLYELEEELRNQETQQAQLPPAVPVEREPLRVIEAAKSLEENRLSPSPPRVTRAVMPPSSPEVKNQVKDGRNAPREEHRLGAWSEQAHVPQKRAAPLVAQQIRQEQARSPQLKVRPEVQKAATYQSFAPAVKGSVAAGMVAAPTVTPPRVPMHRERSPSPSVQTIPSQVQPLANRTSPRTGVQHQLQNGQTGAITPRVGTGTYSHSPSPFRNHAQPFANGGTVASPSYPGPSPPAGPGYPARLSSAPQKGGSLTTGDLAGRSSPSPLRWAGGANQVVNSYAFMASAPIGRQMSSDLKSGPRLSVTQSAQAPSMKDGDSANLSQNVMSSAAMAAAAVHATAGLGPCNSPTVPGGSVFTPGGRLSTTPGAQLPPPPPIVPGSGPQTSGFKSPSHPKLGMSRSEMTHSPFSRRGADGAHSPQAIPPGPSTFTMCRSSTSLTSSNPSFYMPTHSAMGGLIPGVTSPPMNAPVQASKYIVDIADHIDQLLGNALRLLDAAAASKLTLRRFAPGRYEVDGRKVTLRWSAVPGMGLCVLEDEVLDSKGSEMPLEAYLSQAGNVAASLSGQRADMPKISRIPKERRLTFADSSEEAKNLASHIEQIGNERCESMRLAVEQARLREEAATAYEYGLKFSQQRKQAQSRSLPPAPYVSRSR
mmetsp:Transcript_54009/g.96723  ORF Transcript_54009/g.96723 Transcript_54009/m.96723 type:complete len:736 (-) Transcript_54009:54-2261(-)